MYYYDVLMYVAFSYCSKVQLEWSHVCDSMSLLLHKIYLVYIAETTSYVIQIQTSVCKEKNWRRLHRRSSLHKIIF